MILSPWRQRRSYALALHGLDMLVEEACILKYLALALVERGAVAGRRVEDMDRSAAVAAVLLEWSGLRVRKCTGIRRAASFEISSIWLRVAGADEGGPAILHILRVVQPYLVVIRREDAPYVVRAEHELTM